MAASCHKRAAMLSLAIFVISIKSDYIRWLLWRLDSLLLPSLHYSQHVQQWRQQQQLGLARDATDTWSSGLRMAARRESNTATSEARPN